MSVMPALYDELAGVTPILTNPVQDALRFRLLQRTRLQAPRDPQRAHRRLDDRYARRPRARLEGAPFARRVKTSRRAQQQALLAEFVAPPCTEAELLHLADTDWKDPVKRTALVNRWQSEALDRYKSVLAQIAAN